MKLQEAVSDVKRQWGSNLQIYKATIHIYIPSRPMSSIGVGLGAVQSPEFSASSTFPPLLSFAVKRFALRKSKLQSI